MGSKWIPMDLLVAADLQLFDTVLLRARIYGMRMMMNKWLQLNERHGFGSVDYVARQGTDSLVLQCDPTGTL